MLMLEQSITIGKTQLKNRLVMAPVATRKADDDGKVTPALLEHYAARTQGGHIGLVITEHSYIRTIGKASAHQLGCTTDEDIEGLAQLAAAVHQNGSKIILQLNHAGAAIKRDVVSIEGVSPSGVPNPKGALGPGELQATHAMSLSEIDDVERSFLQAATRAKKAGFDGVEIHSAHGYLLNQFFSPLTNKRIDAYSGKSIEGRIQLHRQIIKDLRRTFGGDFIIGLRLGGCDYMDGGSTIEDAAKAAPGLVAAGLDFIDLSGGLCFYTLPGKTEAGYFGDLAKAVKAVVDVPVILAGGVTNRDEAEKLLADGVTDMISVGRAILRDPEWAAKTMA